VQKPMTRLQNPQQQKLQRLQLKKIKKMKKIILSVLLGLVLNIAYGQTQTYQLSTHILDVSSGMPAPGVTVQLEKLNEKTKAWVFVDKNITDEQGRIKAFLDQRQENRGIYKLIFFVKDYFSSKKADTFYPFVDVVFEIKDNKHYHVPITLSAYGYSTYRGN